MTFKTLPYQNILQEIGQVADSLKYECYVVGGFVRDLLLKRDNDDIDVVVVGKGTVMAKAYVDYLRNKGIKAKYSLFENFGTAQVKTYDMEIEFVGARKESYERGSRKPIVEEGTLKDDQLRRDFTINAMAICLNKRHFGKLVDPFNGVDDLEKRIIRTPVKPDITFSDDPLRQLRAVRFASKLNFDIDRDTFEGIQRNADRLSIISEERINVELMKILASDSPSKGIHLLLDSGLLMKFLPEVAKLDTDGRTEKITHGHKNIFGHTLEVLSNVALKTTDPWVRLAALLHDIGKIPTRKYVPGTGYTFMGHETVGANMVDVIFRRLKLPLDEHLTLVHNLVKLHMRPQSIASEGVTDSGVRRRVFDADGHIDELLILAEADITTGKAWKKEKFIAQYEELKKRIEELKQADFVRTFQPCVSGNDIMERYGLPSCKKVGELKQIIKDAVLDGTVENTPEKLYEILDKEMGK
ncbi:MAG: HD domain-containing protein [Clostridia bacterium]|nr:HD domain-containing protein [Clostridia bacterium]